MTELPLSKFAPFAKHEAKFEYEVSNKLKEIGVECSHCIYYGDKADPQSHYSSYDGDMLIENPGELYTCTILNKSDNYVKSHSLCRFFTPVETIVEESPAEEEAKEDEELSVAIQKLDFSNSDIKDSITQLRESLINESN